MKKNILAENLLRFGAKNLTESNKNKLTEQFADNKTMKDIEPHLMQFFQWNPDYFSKNKTGTIKFDPSKGFPSVIEINNTPDKGYTFGNYWKFDNSIFTGRVPAGWKGNNEWKYVYDGTKLTVTPAPGNEIPFKEYGTLTFNPKNVG